MKKSQVEVGLICARGLIQKFVGGCQNKACNDEPFQLPLIFAPLYVVFLFCLPNISQVQYQIVYYNFICYSVASCLISSLNPV